MTKMTLRSWKKWLSINKWFFNDGNEKANRRSKYSRRLNFERLEDRVVPVTFGTNFSVGEQLRHYRLAVGATIEYTNFHGGELQALAAINEFVDDLNALYEPELAIHFDLVSGTNTIFTSSEGDTYSNGDLSSMLTQNQSVMDSVLGTANYDIGFVFGTTGSGGSGFAFLGVVGQSSFKARGGALSSNPQGSSWTLLVAHEIGHMFDGEHTFNGVAGSCSGNRSAGTAYEPASGSTIMSYAGICGSDNLQFQEDPMFHSASFDDIERYINGPSHAAPHTTTTLNNEIPTVDAGSDYTIPAGTPFELTASGTDADSTDILTYSWEQIDLGPSQSLPLSDVGSGPLFRTFLPTTDPTRTFPRLPDLLSNVDTAPLGETLPTTTRTLQFRATVRDGNGGINSDDVRLNVVDTGSTFSVTAPNTGLTWMGGSSQTINWNVAGTTANGIDTSQVRILLSSDGGLTYPHLLAVTENDGNHDISVPNITTSQARIKIQGEGNIFFDVSDQNFAIEASTSAPGVNITESNGETEPTEGGASDTYTIALNTDPAGTVMIRVNADSQTQVSIDGVNFNSYQILAFNSTASQTITVRAINDSIVEGGHNSTISHEIISSDSVDYPMGMLVENVTAHVLDSELPPVVGLDFDCCGRPAPNNWSQVTFLSDDSMDMLRDDGMPTSIDLNLSAFGSFNASTVGPSSSSIPQHTPSLIDIAGYSRATNTVTAVWDDLIPGQQYGIYVMGFESVSGANYSQTITISGASTLPSFTQTLTDGELQVNDEVGTNSRALTSFEKIVAADGNGRITITIAPEGGSAGVSLAGMAIREIPTAVPGVTIIQSNGNTEVTEAGSTDTFTVMLNTQPTEDVVIDIFNMDNGEATVSPTSLTFTSSNWNMPQPVVVTGVDDLLNDGDQVTGVSLTINEVMSDDDYDPLPDLTVNVVTINDDIIPPGFTIVETEGDTVVLESGTTDTFTVQIDVQPQSDVVITVSSNDPSEATVDKGTLTFTSSTWNIPQPIIVTGADDFLIDGDQTTFITLSIDDANSDNNFASLPDQMVNVIAIDNDPLQVTAFSQTVTGFVAEFNQPIDPVELNLNNYLPWQLLGIPDIDVLYEGERVPGTVIIDSSLQSITFVKTGGILEGGDYNITFKTGMNAIKDAGGNMLDGNQDNTRGDDYITSFNVINLSAPVVSIPDFTRGSGQSVDVPNTDTGLPLTISDPSGFSNVTRIQLELHYDTTLLDVTAINPGPNVPSGATVAGSVIDDANGVVTVDFESPGNPLSGGPGQVLDFVTLTASVPESAPHGHKHVLDIQNLQINQGAISGIADDGLHAAVYLGDLNADGAYDTSDQLLIQQLTTRIITNLTDYPNLDRALVADVNRDGQIDVIDQLSVGQVAVDIPNAFIPPLLNPNPPAVFGLDPKLFLPEVTAFPGRRISVPLRLENTDPNAIQLRSFDAALQVDVNLLRLGTVRAVGLAAGAELSYQFDPETGTLLLSGTLPNAVTMKPGEVGTLVELNFSTSWRAKAGQSSPLNLLAEGTLSDGTTLQTKVNGGGLVLIPNPTNDDQDEVDGLVSIVSGRERILDRLFAGRRFHSRSI